MPEYRRTYFHTVSLVQWKWSLGRQVLFAQTITGSVKNRLGTLGSKNRPTMSTQTTKAPSHSYPICGRKKKKEQKKTMEDEPRLLCPIASSEIFNSMSLNLICKYHRWGSLAVLAARASVSLSFSFSCIKQKGIKQLQTKVSTQLGILSSHKVLLQRLTVTFSGSENQGKRHPVPI